VAGTKLLAQNALDAVESAADDGDVSRRHTVGAKLPPRQRHQLAIVELLAISALPDAQPAQMALQIRQQLAIGIPAGEIAHAAGWRGRDGGGGGGGADSRTAPSVGDGDTALLQDSIR